MPKGSLGQIFRHLVEQDGMRIDAVKPENAVGVVKRDPDADYICLDPLIPFLVVAMELVDLGDASQKSRPVLRFQIERANGELRVDRSIRWHSR